MLLDVVVIYVYEVIGVLIDDFIVLVNWLMGCEVCDV